MVKHIIVAFLFGLTCASPDSKTISQNTSPTVSTPLGTIQGSILASRLGKPIYAFRAIRYAQPPIPPLRFQPPVPVEKWEGIYNATLDGPRCPQPGHSFTSEDCLLLNVYTTKLPKGSDQMKQPVLVFFHAGGFHSGASNSGSYSPKYLMDEDIVLVVPSYRLGALGFLSTGDKEAPGNNGLKDQVQALKWVQNNIASFGGDPAQVTIGGYDAGGVSVTLHLVSPMSKGLFSKAIAMSGSAFGNWPIPNNQSELAKKLARFLNCPDDSSTNIVHCLKSKTAVEIAETLPKFREFGSADPVILWAPVIEPDVGQPLFLTMHPVTAVLKDDFIKVPFLTGVTTDEYATQAFAIVNNFKLSNEMAKNFETVAPVVFVYERGTNNSKFISSELKEFYLNGRAFDKAVLAPLAQMFSDGIVGFGVNRAAKLISQRSNESVYYYRFNFKGRHSHFYLPDSNNTVPYGAVHLDDLIYLFCSPSSASGYKEDDPETVTIVKMTKLWANFVKFWFVGLHEIYERNKNYDFSKPTIEQIDELDSTIWSPFTIETKKYMDIGNKLIQHDNLYENRYVKWEELFPLSNYEDESTKKQHG